MRGCVQTWPNQSSSSCPPAPVSSRARRAAPAYTKRPRPNHFIPSPHLGLRSGFDPPDLERPGKLPHQQGLCEARLGYQDESPPSSFASFLISPLEKPESKQNFSQRAKTNLFFALTTKLVKYSYLTSGISPKRLISLRVKLEQLTTVILSGLTDLASKEIGTRAARFRPRAQSFREKEIRPREKTRFHKILFIYES